MDSDKLTIAIPFYSNVDFLKKAIQSVLAQTNQNWLIVVSDDHGPNPEAADLVDGFKDDRIRYFRSSQSFGMAANWSHCLELAETELVTLLHADDELLPNYVELMLSLSRSHPTASTYFCGTEIIDENSKPKFSFPDWYKSLLLPKHGDSLLLSGEPALSALLRGNFIMCPTVCYRRSKIGGRRFNSKWKFVLDFEFSTALLLEDRFIVGVPKTKGYAYRRHGGNATTAYTHNLLRFEEEAALYQNLAEASLQKGWKRAAAIATQKRIIVLNVFYCLMNDLFRLKWDNLAQKIRFLRLLFSPNISG